MQALGRSSHEDEAFMRECLELAEKAGRTGDLPFGAVVVREHTIIGRGYNTLIQKREVDGHAERIALLQAQKLLHSRTLSDCTLYSNVEPCPMCSFLIRELGVRKVVFGLPSFVMGGYSKFNILQDTGLSNVVPDYFAPPPIIVGGVLKKECTEIWKHWDPTALRLFGS